MELELHSVTHSEYLYYSMFNFYVFILIVTQSCNLKYQLEIIKNQQNNTTHLT